MSTRENIRLIARAPLVLVLCSTAPLTKADYVLYYNWFSAL